MRLNQTSNTGTIYQLPTQRKKQVFADEVFADKGRRFVDDAAAVSANEERQKSVVQPHVSASSSGIALDSVHMPVFKIPEIKELPTRSQKAISAYQSVATAMPTIGVEIIGIDLFV